MSSLKEVLPHIALIAKAEIKKKEFSQDLVNMINSFDRRYDGWWNMNKKKYEAGDETALKSYQSYTSESTIIAQHIYDYFIEEEDQVNDPSVSEMASQIKDTIDDVPPVKPVVADPPPADPVDPTPPLEPAGAPPEPKPPVDTPPKPPVDPAPPAPPDEPEPDEKDERILARLFKEGKVTDISRALLKEKGLDTGFWSDLTSTGMTAGKYRLFKKASEQNYNLEKL